MQTTANYGLKKPDGTDVVNIQDFNDNADVTDTTLAGKVDKVTGKQLSTEDYSTAEKSKLAGIATGANNYVHPSTHPPSIIVQDSSNRFVTDSEKSTWNGKAGTAVATTGANGLMSSADKSKLDGIATGANAYVHPSGDGNQHVPATGTTHNGQVLRSGATAGSAAWGALTKSDVGLGNVDNTADSAKNVASAAKLTTARTISLTGDVTGSASFDGSANASITATVADDSHNHIIANVDGLQSALNAKADQTVVTAHLAEDATLTTKGHVQLSSSTTSTSTTLAATPSAVKVAMDKANAAIPSSQKGVANGVATLGADGKISFSQLPVLSASGIFSDTTTVIGAGMTYTKTIPLEIEAKTGSIIIFAGGMAYYMFNTNPASTKGFDRSSSNQAINWRDLGSGTSPWNYMSSSNSNLRLTGCYIEGTNLKLVIYNYGASNETLGIQSCTWEVQA
ncbi:tail fiber protein [Desulfosporosinus youngiae]|uniref:Phage-related tail fiber protein n=1 Tax=Desulfosporosinus youngiae DSM 17734 TaxID=768710 RepID=H5Y2P0_9FIRM|nr:tail fiber protein [Desulfosporosinus youngiae]EHQ88303.1 phage-related tail fiber protein [Desulfosporosinus youngiae DSM 17734]